MDEAVFVIKSFATTISWYSVFIIFLSVGCVLACYFTGFIFEMRLDFIGLSVVFPLVFSINSAFQRREQALQHLANMKSNAYSIRYCFYHWMEGKFLPTSGPKDIDYALLHLFKKIADYFKSDEFSEVDYMTITAWFQTISWLIEVHLRRGGVPPPNISRVNESLRSFMSHFELMRNIKRYRTPLALRAYTKLFVSIFPILFSPLFAWIATLQGQLWGALVMVVLYSVVLTGLDAIQDGLEEPFDGLGIDDVHFGEYQKHMMYPVITPGHTKLHIEPDETMFVRDLESGEETLIGSEQEVELELAQVHGAGSQHFSGGPISAHVDFQEFTDGAHADARKSKRRMSRLANRSADTGVRSSGSHSQLEKHRQDSDSSLISGRASPPAATAAAPTDAGSSEVELNFNVKSADNVQGAETTNDAATGDELI